MGIISEKVVSRNRRPYRMMIESYNSAQEMVRDLKTRSITNSSFQDKSRESFDSWEGVKTYEECLNYLSNGYQPTVEKLKESIKPNVKGESKRISFKNDMVGGMPIVPLAMMGIPTSMVNTTIKPIKAKVIDIYYDITCASRISSKEIIEAGQKLLATIMRFEQQGYKFNLYAVQTYSDDSSCDMLTIKVKSSSQPLDLKRMSYTLTHTSFFRVLGFDWYSRTPKGKYRSCYGKNLSYYFDFNGNKINEFAQQIFGKNSIYLSAMIMNENFRNRKDEYISSMINMK